MARNNAALVASPVSEVRTKAASSISTDTLYASPSTKRLTAFDLASALAAMNSDDAPPTLRVFAPPPPAALSPIGEDKPVDSAPVTVRDTSSDLDPTTWRLILTLWAIAFTMVAACTYLVKTENAHPLDPVGQAK
jgi:hypothetical protein